MMLNRALPLCFALALLAPPALAAQVQLGAIQGTITDESGAVLPGGAVTVTHIETGVARTTVSNETGVYRAHSLDPGRYRIAANLEGFRRPT